MSDRIPVCAVVDLPPGERILIEAEGHEVGVFNVNGEFFALENDCCHLGGPVCTGKVTYEIIAEYPGPGKRVIERFSDNPTIACPWHGYEYELATGKHIGAGEPMLESYDVIIEGGMVCLDLDG